MKWWCGDGNHAHVHDADDVSKAMIILACAFS